ncbi:unnamed protein product [Clonostachys rosea]|uniref:Alpha/beta hydrolase fold-3 domain-containing protein n=1 Tax=Bionectria ochroleuca TaxID=29856 RepID=A0ABY6TXT0_BIOOC|nr:unnamed protein product [Clonostachys rosea]
MDPELAEAMAPFAAAPKPDFKDALQIRAANSAVAAVTFMAVPFPEGIEETSHSITSPDRSTSIEVHRFLPRVVKDGPGPHRAVVFAFGGGFISGSVQEFRSFIGKAAVETQSQYFGVQYRYAPEHPFPAGAEDFFSAIKWVQEHAAEFNVDPARVIVHGHSAGAGLAAGVALMARDKGLSPPLAGQVLKYPMLDDRTSLSDDHPLSPFLSWSDKANKIGWQAYLGGKEQSERTEGTISPYAAPARADDLSGLPKTFIEVGGLDLFRDEIIAYVARLTSANVEVEFHLYPGLFHAYDGLAPNITLAKASEQNIFNFIKNF